MVQWLSAVLLLLAVYGFTSEDVECLGKLPNGLTYYIKKNTFPKEKATLRLVVKVGSLYETEDECGVAHFLEHMAFRGSKHFSNDEITTYLNGIGASLSPDANAYTTFEQTVYVLNVPQEELAKGILLLSDIAGRLKLDKAFIETERGILCEEHRLSEASVQGRQTHKMYETFFAGSAYPNRLPMGKKEVILQCKQEAIRQFYEKWYQPDRMAIIAVGDFDIKGVAREIEACFGNLPSQPCSSASTKVPFSKKVKTLISVDPEETFIKGGFVSFSQKRFSPQVKASAVREELVGSLFTAILNARLKELVMKESPAPFMQAMMVQAPFTTVHEGLFLYMYGFSDRPLEGLKTLYREADQLRKLGPSTEELAHEIAVLKERLSLSISNLDKISSDVFAQTYMDHFIHQRGYIEPEKGFQLRQTLLEKITARDLIKWAGRYLKLEKMHRMVTMPMPEKTVTKETIEGAVIEVRKEKKEKPKKKPTKSLQIEKGASKIVKETLGTIGDTTLMLDSGVKVILHPTQLEKGRVSLEMFGVGGKTLIPETEFASMELAPEYVLQSGIANLDGANLQQLLQTKDCTLSFGAGANYRFVTARGPTKQMEVLLQMVRALFLAKQFDETGVWDRIVAQRKESEIQRESDPRWYFYEQAQKVLYGEDPFFLLMRSDKANREMAKQCMKRLFSDMREFVIVIAGDFDVAEFKKLAAAYLDVMEDIPKVIQRPRWEGVDEAEHIIYRGLDPHGVTMIQFRAESLGERWRQEEMQVLTHILTQRLIGKIRQEMGDAYGINMSYGFPFDPITDAVGVYVCYISQPAKAKRLKEQTLQVIDTFLRNGLAEEEVASAKDVIRLQVKQGQASNAFWIKLHVQAVCQDLSIKEVLTEKEDLSWITPETIHALGKRIFAAPAQSVSLYPEKPLP